MIWMRRILCVCAAVVALAVSCRVALAAEVSPAPTPTPGSATMAPVATPMAPATPAPINRTAAPNDTKESTGLQRVIENFFGGDNATTVQIALLLTVLTLAPSILMMLTGFTRIIIVLSFMRNAMGTQQMPSNQVLIGLALFLTLFVMWPTFEAVKTQAYDPFVAEEISQSEAISRAAVPISEFMLSQTQKTDLDFFVKNANLEAPPETPYDVPFRVLAPAFITSEIKRAFSIGFAIYIPFIVIDMVVASTLMSLGMMMLPPSMISLPFKVLLFIMVDGWQLTIGTLLKTFVN